MRLATLVPLVLLFAGAGSVPLRGQSRADDRWQITTDSDDYIWDIRLVRLTGDSLVFRQTDTLGAVRIEQIKELRLIRKTTMRVGEGEGAGGAMAALTGADDEIYDLQTLDFSARIRAIQQILLIHPPTQ